jgi:glycosyltransferase involved in cell wall biosynthesis
MQPDGDIRYMRAHELKKTDRKIRVHAQLGYGLDVTTYEQAYCKGNEPDRSPYGFHHAIDYGFDLSFSRDAPRRFGIVARVLNRLMGFDILHAFTNRDRVRAADVIWVMTEREAFALALLFAFRLVPRRPMIANVVWLFNRWRGLPPWTRWFYRRLARYISRLTVHSAGCLEIAPEALPDRRVELMYFGVNTSLFTLTPPVVREMSSPIRLFAAGNDHTRDWTTLLNAFGNDPRFELLIICRWLSHDLEARYDNLKVARSATMPFFLDCYADADLVIMPMHENIFSGITVALEAVAVGKPLVSSRTGGIPTYFSEADVTYVPADDPEVMRRIVLETHPATWLRQAEAAQAKFRERDYSTHALMGRYAALTHELL